MGAVSAENTPIMVRSSWFLLLAPLMAFALPGAPQAFASAPASFSSAAIYWPTLWLPAAVVVLNLLLSVARVRAVLVRHDLSLDRRGLATTACASLGAILLFVQLHLPSASGGLTTTAADLVALASLAAAPFILWACRANPALPRLLLWGLLAVSILLVEALVHGYLRHGWISWAFYNRGFGWLVILGYISLGVSLTLLTGEALRRTVLIAFLSTGATVAVLQVGLLYAVLLGVEIPRSIYSPPPTGYTANTNAFALQMVMVGVSAIVARHLGLFGQRRYMLPLALSLLAVAIYFSLSRAGIVMFVVLLVVMMLAPLQLSRRELLPALLWPVAALIFSHYTLPLLSLLFAGNHPLALVLDLRITRESGDLERWVSITEGWNMWLQHPIFGAGLGAYMQHRLAQGATPLVIHSVPVWLLAETGLAGFMVVAATFAGLLRQAIRALAGPDAAWSFGMVAAIVCISTGGLVHDFLVQRSFWFLLGLFAVAPQILNRTGPART